MMPGTLWSRGPIALEHELVDLSQPGRDRSELGPPVLRRDLALDRSKPLHHELSREPRVRALCEDHGHGAGPFAGDRAYLLE
jgi:hypothetical protein